MTDSERIAVLEKRIADLQTAVLALASGGAVTFDTAGNLVASTVHTNFLGCATGSTMSFMMPRGH